MALLINILLVFYVVVALLMVLVILMQRPKSEGLGAAFGGGVTENIFGAQTTNVLTKITAWLATLLFLLTFGLSILYAHKASNKGELHRELMKDQPAGGTSSATPGGSPSSTVGANSTTPDATVSPDSAESEAPGAPSPAGSEAPKSSPASSAEQTRAPELANTPSTPPKGTPKP
jgi:preprotein translocase subunit SecG